MKALDEDLNAGAKPDDSTANVTQEREPPDDTGEEQTVSEAALRMRLLGKLVIPRAPY